MSTSHWESLAYAHGGPLAQGVMKHTPEDFRVDEILGFEPDGEGEHLCVRVRAKGQNTAWLVKALAQWAGVPKSSVSFSGQKDRHAITTQWFSLHLPGKTDPALTDFQVEGAEILQARRHSRKIRTGTHWGNQFEITLRQLVWQEGQSADTLLERLQYVANQGVPNYFGAQRFGNNEANLKRAFDAVDSGRLPRDRDERGWIFSALRSYLFNLWLSARVSEGVWREWLPGDILQRRGRRGFFVPESLDDETEARLRSGELVPAGVLPGDEAPQMQADAKAFVERVWAPQQAALDFLHKHRLTAEVRSAVLFAENFEYDLEATDLRLKFSLPKGSFATALLREIIRENINDVGFRPGL